MKSWGRREKGGIKKPKTYLRRWGVKATLHRVVERVHIDGLRYGTHAYLEDPPEKEGNVTKFANGGVQDAPRL
jgi:hypothetical protein